MNTILWSRSDKSGFGGYFMLKVDNMSDIHAILFRIDNILSWYRIVKHRLFDSFHVGDEIRMKWSKRLESMKNLLANQAF